MSDEVKVIVIPGLVTIKVEPPKPLDEMGTRYTDITHNERFWQDLDASASHVAMALDGENAWALVACEGGVYRLWAKAEGFDWMRVQCGDRGKIKVGLPYIGAGQATWFVVPEGWCRPEE